VCEGFKYPPYKLVARAVCAALAAALAALQSPAAAPAGFEAQGRKRLLTAYRSFNKETERTAQFAAMGIATRCIFIANTVNGGGNPYCEYPPVWTGPKRYDWSRLDAQFFDILAASPNARFMAMIDLNTPYWAVRRLRVDSHADITHASCNAKWRSLAREWLVDCIAYAEKRWGAHIDCYILSGGASETARPHGGASIGINVKRSREAKGSETDETSPTRRAVCGKTARTV